MSKLFEIAGGITACTSVLALTTAHLLLRPKTTTFKEQFKISLISEDEEKAEELFKERLKKLKNSTTEPDNEKLKLAKYKAKAKPTSEIDGLEELKEGCKEIYSSEFINKKNSDVIKDFADYCSKTNILLWRNNK